MACRRCLLLLAAWTPVQMAFQLAVPSAPVTTRGAAITMTSAEAVAKKSIVVDAVKEDMEGAMLMFCVRSEGIKVNDINIMRQKFPETTKFRCVKNTLLKRAAQEVPKMQGGDELCKRSNYWFFVPESDVRVSFDIWNDWVQETKNEELEIVGGVFEGECLDKAGIERITKLPTKQELMQSTAIMLKKLPATLAQRLNEAGAERIARATKQASGQKLVQAVKAIEGKL